MSEPTRPLPELSEPTVGLAGSASAGGHALSSSASDGSVHDSSAHEPTSVLATTTPVADARPSLPSPWERDAGEIATLPPLEELHHGVPVSPATGEPRRETLPVIAIAALCASSLAAALAFAKAYWDTVHVQRWPNSIAMLRWADARAGSWQSVLLAVALGLIGLVMVAAPLVAAWNAWNGWRVSQRLALVAVGTSLLAVLLNGWAWVALPLAIAAAVVLHLPAVSAYFDRWRQFRAGDQQPPLEVRPTFYGPLPRYR